MTNVILVTRKLAVLDEHLRRLRERRPATVEVLRNDLVLQDAIAMGVLVVVQEAMDIALHIASDEGWELAGTYREAFSVLSRHGVIDPATAAALAGAAQLRNRIAHGYASVDLDRIWAELPTGIETFASYAASVARHINPAAR